MECCGTDMYYAEVFGIRIYKCMYRSHHPMVFVRQSDGEAISEDDLHWV